MFRFKLKKLILGCLDISANVVRPVMNRVAMRQAENIPLERKRRALASTVDFIERNMTEAKPASSKFELLTRAFQLADVSSDRLICEFGVFKGGTINHLATLTSKTIFGFDSFEGLPHEWHYKLPKSHFAVSKLPAVRTNVKLIKGWFDATLPPFLKEHDGLVGFLHIDCDLYSSTKTVFDLLQPRLVPGSVIVFDEYFNHPNWEAGEHKALQEFLQSTGFGFKFIGYTSKGEQVAGVLIQKS